MRRHCLIVAGVLAVAAPAIAGDLPSVPVPSDMHALDVTAGRILVDRFHAEGGPAAASTAFRVGLRNAQRYFNGTLQLGNVVRSNDGATMLGVFHAKLGTIDVTGLEIAGVDGRGDAQNALLFDRTAQFPKTAPILAQRLQATTPPIASSDPRGNAGNESVQQAVAHVATTPVRARDGSASAAVPQGWHVAQLANGILLAQGPDDANVAMNLTLSFVDPNSPAGARTLQLEASTGVRSAPTLPYSDDPGRVYIEIGTMFAQAAHKPIPTYHIETTRLLSARATPFGTVRQFEVAGTQEGGGVAPARYDALLSFGPPGPTGQWTVVCSGMFAPQSRYRELGPQMLAIAQSFRYDQRIVNQQVQAGIDEGNAITAKGWADVRAGIAANQQIEQQNQAKVNASMANASAIQDGIDRSTAGFVHYLGDTDVVRNSATGGDAVVSQSASDALTHFDPQHFQSVPVSQYRKGVDY